MSDTNDTNDTKDHGERVSDAPAPDAPAASAPPRGARAMAVVRWGLVAVMAVVAAAAIAYTMGWWKPSATHEARATHYVCPMHPTVTQDTPGECPICSMNLVPAPEAGASKPAPGQAPGGTAEAPAAAASDVPGLAAVDLTPERIQLAGLRTAPVTRAALAPELRATGTVTATEKGLAQVQTRVAGWIEELQVEETGQRIKKGQILARVYSPEWLTAQQEFLTALRWNTAPPAPGSAADATGTNAQESAAGVPKVGFADGARRRLELLGVAPAEIDEIARGATPLRALAVRSPVAGHVTRKNVVQGQYVQPGAPLFEVADLSKVWVLADVPEHELGRIAVGAHARVELVAFPERGFEGRVDFVYPTVAADTRTVRLRVELDNADFALKPGMYGDVYVGAKETQALVVPSEAVVDTGAVQYVFIAKPGGRFVPRRVRVGATQGESTEIREGMTAGEMVVTTANFLIDSESRLQAAFSDSAPGAEKEAPHAASAPPPSAVAPAPPPASKAQPAFPAMKRPSQRRGTESSAHPSGVAAVPAAAAEPAAEPVTAPAAASSAPPAPPPPARPPSRCDGEFDRAKYPDKYRQCLACEIQHRSMGPTMVDDCKHAIPEPWR